jgi:hypothetical protein
MIPRAWRMYVRRIAADPCAHESCDMEAIAVGGPDHCP